MKKMNPFHTTFIVLFLCFSSVFLSAQNVIQFYAPAKKDSLRVGKGEQDFMPFIQAGYTLKLPENKAVNGVLIFLEDSGYDQFNGSAKRVYAQASENGFAVLSVSTELPLDFYFTQNSLQTAHTIVQKAFKEHDLPNTNIFFLGGSLVGHRALQYIQFLKREDVAFKPKITGIVIVNFTLDWTRKWHQHERDIRLNRINLWEPTFMNFMMETYFGGTPETKPERYHDFSPYSYFDKKNRNIKTYKDLAVRAYAEPAINYRLNKYYRTLYDNNTPDMVGFIAELRLLGNTNTELIIIQPNDDEAEEKAASSTWATLDKEDLMTWILSQC